MRKPLLSRLVISATLAAVFSSANAQVLWGGHAVINSSAVYTSTPDPVGFNIPANSIPNKTVLSWIPNWMTVVSPLMVMGSAHSVGPPGLHFLNASKISIAYDPRNVPTGFTETSLHLYHVLNHEWSLVSGSTVDAVNHVVTGPIAVSGTFGLFASSAASIPPENQITIGLGSDVRNLIKIAPDGTNHRVVQSITPIDIFFGGARNYNASENATYYGIQSPNGSDFLLTAIDGSNPTKITSLNLQNANFSTTSADGSTFVASLELSNVWKVYRLNADGTGAVALGYGGSTGWPVYNLQNTEIAYADNNVIHIVGATGTAIRTITLTGQNIQALAFNPAGTSLAFVMKASSSASNAIYTVPVTGGAATKRSAGNSDWLPVWSPDGLSIAYLATSLGQSSGVYIIPSNAMNALGTNLQTTDQGDITMFWR